MKFLRTNRYSIVLQLGCLALAVLLLPLVAFAEPEAGPEGDIDRDGWTSMPEGGKPAFVGVQGGTAPASVFYTEDGADITTQVGLGSNDFLEAVQGEERELTAENLIPFGYVEEVSETANVASREPEALPRILPRGVTKIYDQELGNDLPLLTNELTRI